jgi:hypothetical protein
MKRYLITMMMGMALATASWGAPMLTIGTPHQTGSPGQTVGWGFSLTADENYWVSVIGSYLDMQTNPSLGMYEDRIGLQGGPVDYSLAPQTPAWTQEFDGAGFTGLGAFLIDPFAPDGSLNSAEVVVQLEYFSGNPMTCGDCYVGFDELRQSVSVTVSDVPEPATMTLCGAALIGTVLWRRRRNSRAAR